MTDTDCHDVVVIGAGAAGMLCALTAGRRGRRVVVLDHAREIGRKILVSGGGRCNFTNLWASPENYLTGGNPDFCKSALARYRPEEFIHLVERHRIPYHEKKLGQLFCDRSAREIVAMLVTECRRAGVELRHPVEVRRVRRNDRFVVETSAGRITARCLVVATGGLSLPKLGASGLGYQLARQFGHAVGELAPGLVGLRWADDRHAALRRLAGVAADARVACAGACFRENILFTHRGLSGPAILQASNYWAPGGRLTLDLLPGLDLRQAVRSDGALKPLRLLGRHLPDRLVREFAGDRRFARPLAQLPQPAVDDLLRRFHQWQPEFAETDGYARAEVTRGGVSTARLSSQRMESRDVRGLFFIGEVVDVTGWLGGYNFQWAWASGHAAGSVV